MILDVDGTLVDSNYHHAVAWARAFAQYDLTVPLWRIHRAIGMGGDKLVAHVAGDAAEQRLGEALRDQWTREFDRLIEEVRPFDGARTLLEEVKLRGHHLVLASSGQPQHVETFLRLFDGESLADAWTTADDADESKPAADLLEVALSRVGGSAGVMVGDATWARPCGSGRGHAVGGSADRGLQRGRAPGRRRDRGLRGAGRPGRGPLGWSRGTPVLLTVRRSARHVGRSD